MISLEGLTLATGRHDAARDILHTFAHHVRDGLIPNLFPEGENEGLYHTADATLWFFHALDRYESRPATRDAPAAAADAGRDRRHAHRRHALRHRRRPGRRPAAPGRARLQLTWMDAKVGDWVVTPRRGKPVEINALFYNALRVMERWLREAEARARRPRRRRGRSRARAPTRCTRRSTRASGTPTAATSTTSSTPRRAATTPASGPTRCWRMSLPYPVLDPAAGSRCCGRSATGW